jgi:hypothetical protein
VRVKTAEQYAERFKRRGGKQRPSNTQFHALMEQYHRDPNYMRKPNHGARAQSIEDVFGSDRPAKGSVERGPNVAGIALVGQLGTCQRTLVQWKPYYDPDAFVKDIKGRLKYIPYVYPCVVDHGHKRHSNDRRVLIRLTGKKGEHRDTQGRTW